jgi:hypothetical protein
MPCDQLAAITQAPGGCQRRKLGHARRRGSSLPLPRGACRRKGRRSNRRSPDASAPLHLLSRWRALAQHEQGDASGAEARGIHFEEERVQVLLQNLEQHTAFGIAPLVAAGAAHLGAVAMGNAGDRNR